MRNFGIKIGVVVILGFALIACKTTEEFVEEITEDVLGPDDRIVQGTAVQKLFAADGSDTTTLHIDYSYFSTQFSSNVMDSTYKDSVNSIIRKAVIGETMTSMDGFFLPLTPHYFDAQLDSVAKEWDNYKDEESNPWEIEMSIGIQDHPTFVEVNLAGWSYTGGAHGNGYDLYIHVDRNTGNELTVGDFFTDLNELNQISEKYFRKLFELSETESLNEYGFWFDNDQFSVNDNFTISGDNILFYYNTYEIAPYAGGPTELFVPMDKIKHLLKRQF